MALAVSITQDDLYAKLGTFLESVLPAGLPVIQLPVDRVAMPPADPGFVGMTINMQARIMTNVESWDQNAADPTVLEIEQAVRTTIKMDCYGADAGNWAVILSTVLRDEYGINALAPVLAPLYVNDPRFAPLTNAELQFERRWIVEGVFQFNPVISVPMQFADAAEASLINVDERYPP